ncbi:MAG: prolipoprotein diacylglyceryl transferase [Sandaracinaceae bacterium]|nr:prolipoprotein diacylglyceryl transferase [Sandaracinaceae bacterium]
MHPVAFVLELGGHARPIGTYGVCAAAGILVAGALAVRAAHRGGLDEGRTIAAIAIAIGLGFTTAWLTFALVELVRTGTLDALRGGGGLVAFGAVPGLALAALVARRALRLDALRALELALPGLAAGHALGRAGCFLGGCCFGAPFDGPWSVVYRDPLAPAALAGPIARHPSPLYEALGLLALALAFACVPARRPGSGRRLAAYVAAYSALRIAVELTRGDAVRGVLAAGLSTSTLIALVLGALAAAALARPAPPSGNA